LIRITAAIAAVSTRSPNSSETIAAPISSQTTMLVNCPSRIAMDPRRRVERS
jgi:hypothetical protein